MVAWREVEAAAPELAERVQAMFDAGRHKTIATLRADGAPRISGIECEFVEGDLRFGSMDGARKGADLERDARFALHGPTVHPEPGKENEWPGEAKIAGRATAAGPVAGPVAGDGSDEPTTDAPQGVMFVADITEVVVTRLNEAGDALIVEWWTPQRGRRQIERA